MSSEFGFGQNPSTTPPNFPPKVIKQLVAKNKPSKRSRKTKINKNNNINNIINNYTSNKPLKVVYISNPMKFQVNADEFLNLVQGLTGRDAVEWPDENFNSLAQDVAFVNGGVVHDEVQQEPLIMFDDHDQHQVVQVDCYDGSSPDYFGPLDGDVVCGDEDNEHLINMEDFQAFMFSDDN